MENILRTGINNKQVTILLVEDDDGDAKAVKRAFQKAKIANPILRAEDGVEALEILNHQHEQKKLASPYILLVDLNMPRMGGIELIENLRKDPKLSRSLAFILTTSKREEDKDAAYDLNVAGYITKEEAGQDFLKLAQMMDYFWRIVELP